ncbi:MAG: NAD-dependent epimerase/dehydratase family protein [Actinomycetota bacterium]
MRVLITGANGFVGQRLARHLAPRHNLILADLHAPEAAGWVTVDVRRLQDVERAAQGVEAIIHLAVASGAEGEYEDDAFNDLRFDVNVKGTRNVFEAAVRCGVRRVVYTSSLMVVWGYGPDEPVGPFAAARPVGTYALTKQLGEVIASDYSQRYGLETVCLRIAKPVDLDDAAARARPIRPQWIAFPDLCRAYQRALEAPNLAFEIIHLVGESSRRRWDLSRAEAVLGYRPTLRLEDLGYRLGSETE